MHKAILFYSELTATGKARTFRKHFYSGQSLEIAKKLAETWARSKHLKSYYIM